MGMNTEIMLPCEPSAIVYTINEDYFACDGCPHEAHAKYMPEIDRRGCDKGLHCPLRIREHIVEGFEVRASPDGKWIVSKPGLWGYEGLEEFGGYCGKVFYSLEDAEKAMAELNAMDAEHERGRVNDG